MHSQIDPAGEQSFLNLLREYAFAANDCQRRRFHLIAGSLDQLNGDFCFGIERADLCPNPFGLPERELRTA